MNNFSMKSSLQVLENPKTNNYVGVKELALGSGIPWYWNPNSTFGVIDPSSPYTNIPFFSHSILHRPEAEGMLYSGPESSAAQQVASAIIEILEINKIKINYFLRISLNCTIPTTPQSKTCPHYDHRFYHKNFIAYLNDSDGDTVIGGRSFSPKEDACIVFTGEHYGTTPTTNRRVILVATFVDT